MSARRAHRVLGLTIALCAALLLPATASGQEPAGYGGHPWGAAWQAAAINALPGCETQGELVTDVDGFVARVAQPECVGYRLSDGERVNVILLYPDIRWHSLERARAVVDGLVSMPRLWGLQRETVAQLRRVAADLARLVPLRPLYGADGPAVPDRAEDVQLPAWARGLQGCQINFTQERYDRVRAAALAQRGSPSAPGSLSRMTPPGSRGEVLEWAGEHTVAILRQHGPVDTSGYLVVLTRAYLTLLTERPGTAEAPSPPSLLPRPNPTSHAWFLEIVESFSWARETAKAGPTP